MVTVRVTVTVTVRVRVRVVTMAMKDTNPWPMEDYFATIENCLDSISGAKGQTIESVINGD